MKNLILIALMGYLPVSLAEGPGATVGGGFTNWQEERKVKTKPPIGNPVFTNWQNERRVKKPVSKKPVTRTALSDQQTVTGANLSVQDYIQGNANTISGFGSGNESTFQNVFDNTIDIRNAPIHDGSAPEGIPGAVGGSAGATR
jgi:hypothetical protein